MKRASQQDIADLEIPIVRQFTIIAVCLLITIVDGFDLLSIAVVAPLIARDWNLDPVQLGIVFSSGLAGMGGGALFLSPLGDVLGRKTAIIINLFLVAAGMIGAAYSQDLYQLAGARVLAGLGIGAMISNTSTLILEYVPAKLRTLALGLMLLGNPVGNLLSGVVALFVIERAGWEALFLFGGLTTFALIPIVVFGMPESIVYLLRRRPRNALARVNRALRSVGVESVESLPPATERREQATRFAELYRGRLLRRTILIGAIQFIFMFAYYIFMNWSPKLVTEMGASDQAAVVVAMMINIGGIAGPLLVGFITIRLGLSATTSLGFVFIAIGLAAFGLIPPSIALIGAVALLTGLAIYATQVPLLSLIAGSYPIEVRTSAVGLAFAIGRTGSVLGPSVAGLLLENGFGRAGLFTVAALPIFVAAVLVRRVPEQEA